MTTDELKNMQEEAKKRHGFVEPQKSMAEILNENFDFIDGELILKQRYKKRQEKKLLPYLMADKIPLPCTSDKNIPITKKSDVMSSSVFDKPYVPKPVQRREKRPYTHFTALPPDPPKQIQERPPAIYTNSKTYYGIYDELKKEWNKKTG